MKIIEIVVSPEGNTRLETKGFSGSVCREASQDLVSALGTPQGEQLTAEYHATTSSQQNHLTREE